MQPSKYKLSNKAQHSGKQSVKQVQATAGVKMSLFSSACPKTNTLLFADQVDDLLIKHLPLFNQTHHEVIDVTNVGSIHPLFQYAADVIVHRTKIRAVGQP